MTYYPALFNRMNPFIVGGDVVPPNPAVPLIKVTSLVSEVIEGNTITFRVARSINLSVPCSVIWSVVSAGGTGDLTGATSGTVSFTNVPTITYKEVTVSTVNRSGAQGDRAVTFTLSSATGCAIDAAYATATTQLKDRVTTPPTDPPALFISPAVVPIAKRTFEVSSLADFNTRYAAAIGGDRINVANGINLGTLTLNRNGNSHDEPIVISVKEYFPGSSAAYLGGKLTVTGKFNVIYGIRANTNLVELRGDGCRFIRMYYSGHTDTDVSIAQIRLFGSQQTVENCDLKDCQTIGIKIEDSARFCAVLNNYVPNVNRISTAKGTIPIVVGDGYGVIPDTSLRHHIAGNYIRTANANNPETRGILINHAYTYVYNNDLNDGGDIEIRSYGVKATLNRVRGGSHINVYGRDNVLNSIYGDAAAHLRVMTGNWDSAGTGVPVAGQFPSAYRTKLIGTGIAIDIGEGDLAIRALATSIEAKASGVVSNLQGGVQEWTVTSTPSEPVAGTNPPTYTDFSQGIGFDLILRPFNHRAIHWRPIGKAANYNVPGGIPWPDYDAGRKGVAYFVPGDNRPWSQLLVKIGQWRCGDTDQGRKGIYRVSVNDTNALGSATGKQVFRKYSVDGSGNIIWGTETKQFKVPKGDINAGGANGVFYPPNENGGDYTYAFAYTDGGAVPTLDMFTDFRGPDAGHSQDMGYTDYGQYRLDEADFAETAGYAKSAARLRWPGTVLRGFEINPSNPAPIRHSLNVAVTRHNNQGADNGAHILNKLISYPADSVDGSLRKNYTDPNQNQGFLPYGTNLRIKVSDKATIIGLLGSNARGIALLHAVIYHGVYVVDGHGQYITDGGVKKGIMQTRIDHLVGRNDDGSNIAGVINDINNAFDIMLPFLFPVGNPPLWTDYHDQDWSDGLPYLGGGGPIDNESVNGAFDVYSVAA